jgi:TonB family protein
MRSYSLTWWQRHTLWLSLLVHLIFLFGFTTMWYATSHETPQSQAPSSISSYLAPSPPPAPAAPASSPSASAVPRPEPVQQAKVEEPPKPIEKTGIAKPVKAVAMKAEQPKPAAKPAPSTKPHKPTFAHDSTPEDMTNPRDEEPLHLVGESKIVKPLVKILARALSQRLFYPRVAAEFNLRGVVLVGFVLHPEGYITGARVMKSSGAGVLDDTARDAVGAISPVGDVSEYVSAPEFMVIGIIFG